MVIAIAALLTAIAVPSYQQFTARARVAQAIGDVRMLDITIERFRLKNNDRIPLTLDELGIDVPDDSWGRQYQFLNIRTAVGKGSLRKDGALNPLNTDYDLYSVGEDGSTAMPLSAKAARDDIVRANNGAYIGLGELY